LSWWVAIAMPLKPGSVGKDARWLAMILLVIALGIGFRVSQLEQPAFWVDEVATVTRISGYTHAEILADLLDGQGRSPASLQRYQQVGERPFRDTLHALVNSPEHSPLYFLVGWGWMTLFGSSVATIRSLSVALGLLLLPAMYGFCRQLDPSPRMADLAVGLVAISPYLIAYSREARPYSLWALVLILGCGALIRALRRATPQAWGLYSLMVMVNLYTSLLSLPVLVGQGVYVGGGARKGMDGVVRSWLWAAGLGLLGFLPWVWVMVQHRAALEENVSWIASPLPLAVMVGVWLYSGAILIFDVPIAPFPSAIAILQGGIALFVLSILGWAVVVAVRRVPFSRWGLGLALALPTPLALLLLDGIQGGQVSATSRYLFPAQLGLVLALAGWLGHRWETHPKSSRMVAIALLLLCLVSAGSGVGRSPNYQKGRNLHNQEIAAVLNRAPAARVLTEADHAFDLLSLSHNLADSVQLQVVPEAELLATVPQCATVEAVFLLNPSATWRDRLTSSDPDAPSLTEAYQPTLLTETDIHLSLWRVEPSRPCSP